MPSSAKSNQPTPAPKFGEVATTGDANRDISREIQGLVLEPEDKVLKAKGGSYELYSDLLRDDQVYATFQQRRLAVISREWEVMPGGETPRDQEAADWLKATLERIDWDGITDKMLHGLFFGYAIAECIYAPGEVAVELQEIKVRNQRRFKFGLDGLPKLVTKENKDGEQLPPAKFWHFAVGASHSDEPYGLGLGHYVYWPVFFKRNGIKSWLKFLEKFAAPTKVGKYQPGATDDEKKRLLQALAAIGEDTGVILPDGMSVEFLEAARSGTADYATLQERMDAAISKIVLSQTMTTDSGSSYAQANVHAGVKQEVVKSDTDLVCQSFNQSVVKWLCAWNFPDLLTYPKVWRRVLEEPDLLPQAQRDEIIATKLGFPPNQQYIQETYGDGFAVPEEAEQATLTGTQMEQLLKILEQSKGYSPEKRSAILKLAFPTLPDDQIAILIAEDEPAPAPVSEQNGNGNGSTFTTPTLQTIDLSEPLPQRNETVDAFVAQLRKKAQPEFERMTSQVREALNGSADLLEFRERLDGLYPDLDGETLTQVMAEAMFASKLAGIFEAQEEGE